MSFNQINLRHKMRMCLLAAVAGFLHYSDMGTAIADEAVVTGTNGADGASGTAGSVNGVPAKSGQDVSMDYSDPLFGYTNAISTGGNGGKGGDGYGAPGVVGFGGGGGYGGRATAATSGTALFMKAEATGGVGGNSGSPGIDPTGSVSDISGDAGSGGSAAAMVTQGDGLAATAIATGGKGGLGHFSDGGYGGYASSYVSSNSVNQLVEVRSTATGAAGGDVMGGGRTGGGGDALAHLLAYGPMTGSVFALAIGGDGGKALDGSPIMGGNGGNAYVEGSVLYANSANLTLTARAGKGGDGSGIYDGGQGGIVGILNPQVSSSNDVRLNMSLTAGSGGDALGTGNGGDGRSISFVRDLSDFAIHLDGVQSGMIRTEMIGGTGGNSAAQSAHSGQGGAANVSLTYTADYGTSMQVEANALAGTGGFAYNGGTAGATGDALASVVSTNTSSTGSNEAIARAYGGFGGTSVGGISSNGSNAQSSVVASGSGDKVYGYANAYGGWGGGYQQYNGTAGSGANGVASGHLTGGQETSLALEAVGGNGGSSLDSAGGAGGNASFGPIEISSDGSLINLLMTATAGNGGIGGGAANGGQAGSAQLGSFLIQNSTSDFSNTDVWVRGYVTGGNGGGAQGTGNGADGGTVNLNNAINISAVDGAKSLTVYQYATGGKGGVASDASSTSGNGGDAVSSISLQGSFKESMLVLADSTGAHGGDNVDGTGGNGGNAVAYSSATNTGTGDATASSHAYGGQSGSGAMGSGIDGTAIATSVSNSAFGNALSGTESYSLSDSRTYSISHAENGLAKSLSYNTSEKFASAESTSSGQAAYSYASSRGLDGYAKSISTSDGIISLNVSVSGVTSINGTPVVSSFTSLDGSTSPDIFNSTAFSYAMVNPTSSVQNAMQSGIAEAMVSNSPPAGYETFVTGGIMGGFAPGSTTIAISLDPAKFLGSDLYIDLKDGQITGFTDPNDAWSLTIKSMGNGFSQHWDSSMIAFNDLFNDNSIHLGTYNLNWQDLLVSMDWNAMGFEDKLTGSFVIGGAIAAVPEPSSLMVGAILAAGGLWKLKRRRLIHSKSQKSTEDSMSI